MISGSAELPVDGTIRSDRNAFRATRKRFRTCDSD